MDIQKQLETADRHLANILTYYPRVDGRVSAIFAISTGQIVVSAVNFSAITSGDKYSVYLFATFLVFTFAIHIFLYLCTFPTLNGGSHTNMFFGHISKMGESDFVENYREMSEDDFLRDLTKQIWRSSHILTAKYKNLRHATVALGFATVAWAVFLISVSVQTGKLPLISP